MTEIAASDSRENDELAQECAVCVDRYRDPRKLECAHHFCKVCLEQIAERHPQKYVTCPTCRHISNTEDLNDLPRYRIVNDFCHEVESFTSESETPVDIDCDLCENVAARAVKACLVCLHNFCETCAVEHGELESDSSHKLQKIVPEMFCPTHNAHNVWFCVQCRGFCCAKCVIKLHKGHDRVTVQVAASAAEGRIAERIDKLEVTAVKDTLFTISLRELKQKTETSKNIQDKRVESLKRKLKSMKVKLDIIQKESAPKVKVEIKHLEMMMQDMDDYMSTKSKLIKHLVHLKTGASIHELIATEINIPKHDNTLRDRLLCKSHIDVLHEESVSPTLMSDLEECEEKMKIVFMKYQLIPVVPEIENLLGTLKVNSIESCARKIFSLNIQSIQELEFCVECIYDKALSCLNPEYTRLCAELCNCLIQMKFPKSNIISSSGETTDFKRLLLNRCQTDFETDLRPSQSIWETCIADMRSQFLAELSKAGSLTTAILHKCVIKLLKGNCDVFTNRACLILDIIGPKMNANTSTKEDMNKLYKHLDNYKPKERETLSMKIQRVCAQKL